MTLLQHIEAVMLDRLSIGMLRKSLHLRRSRISRSCSLQHLHICTVSHRVVAMYNSFNLPESVTSVTTATRILCDQGLHHLHEPNPVFSVLNHHTHFEGTDRRWADNLEPIAFRAHIANSTNQLLMVLVWIALGRKAAMKIPSSSLAYPDLLLKTIDAFSSGRLFYIRIEDSLMTRQRLTVSSDT